jgi:hypothetical protein
VYIAGATCAAGGLLALLTIRNPARPPAPEAEPECPYACGVGAPGLRPELAAVGAAKA